MTTGKQINKEYSPLIIANYVYELTKAYNKFYAEVSVFNEQDKKLLAFRIAFCKIVAQVIADGMSLFGVEVPERM